MGVRQVVIDMTFCARCRYAGGGHANQACLVSNILSRRAGFITTCVHATATSYTSARWHNGTPRPHMARHVWQDKMMTSRFCVVRGNGDLVPRANYDHIQQNRFHSPRVCPYVRVMRRVGIDAVTGVHACTALREISTITVLMIESIAVMESVGRKGPEL